MKEGKIKKLKYINKRYLINEEMHKSSKKLKKSKSSTIRKKPERLSKEKIEFLIS